MLWEVRREKGAKWPARGREAEGGLASGVLSLMSDERDLEQPRTQNYVRDALELVPPSPGANTSEKSTKSVNMGSGLKNRLGS